MRISRKPPRICDVPLVSSRVSPIHPPLRYKNASPDFSANFGLSLARLRILVKVLNGRQRVAFGQKAEAWRTWRAKSGFLLILRWQGFQELKTSICGCEGSHFHGDDSYGIAAVKLIAISPRREVCSQSPDA
jgi:hypothetical protein